MSLFGLLRVWLLMFGIVQSEWPPENELVSDIDVKNLIQRLLLLEESLKVEKERNDELESTVNSLAINLEQTKRTYEDKFSALEKQLQEHREMQPNLSHKHQHLSDKSQKDETYQKVRRSKHSIDWWKPRYSTLKNQDLNKAPGVSQNMYSTNFQKRLLVQPSPVMPTTVAFYAIRSTTIPESDVTANLVMVFDSVKTNAGNGYHPSTGVFIVPESGMYVFTWSFRNNFDHYHSTQLMVNNNEEGIIHIHTGAGASITGTGIVVLHVNKGDDVYVRIASVSHHGTYKRYYFFCCFIHSTYDI